jgi:hypothetical protein
VTLGVEPLAVADPLRLPGLESELMHRWFVWDAWTAGKRRVDLHPFVLSARAQASAIATAQRAWALVKDAGDRHEAAHYRFHPDVERLAALARDRTAMVRVDLLLRADGAWTACEVNADCPGGYNEAIALPRLARAAGATGAEPPNPAMMLADRLVALSRNAPIALMYATGYAEDLQVCALLERLVRERGGRALRISPTMLGECGDGVGVRGEPVHALYRFYPLEYMAGQRNIDSIARATANGSLTSVSSFACIYAQSKLAMARAFAHDARAGEAFPETHAFGGMDPARLVRERGEWVLKRDLSRVGDHVYVGALMSDEEWAEVVDEIASVPDQTWIAQRFVPQRTVTTPAGERYLTLGVYLLDGLFAGYFARFSASSHCSHDALVLPVFVA